TICIFLQEVFMKNIVVTSAVIMSALCAQSAFALKFICHEKDGLKTRTPIHVSVDEHHWDLVVVHRPNSGHHSLLPCHKDELNNTVCEVSSGNPDLGGGCGNPYMVETFTVHPDGEMTYFYVNNGLIYQR